MSAKPILSTQGTSPWGFSHPPWLTHQNPDPVNQVQFELWKLDIKDH